MHPLEHQIGIHPYPESNSQRKLTYYSRENGSMNIVDTVELPEEMVEDVVVNPELSQILTKNQNYLTRPEEVIKLCRLTVPIYNGKTHSPLLVPKEYGRALPVAWGVVPYAGHLGRIITSKGSLVSGSRYNSLLAGEPVQKMDPEGLFGDRDAAFDLEVSNELLSLGARVALPIGYVTLRQEHLKEFISEHWSLFPKSEEGLLRATQMVYENGDRPAIYLRVGGTLERIMSLNSKYHNPSRIRRAIRTGAHNISSELHAAMEGSIPNAAVVKNTFIRLAAGVPITDGQYEALEDHLMNTVAPNTIRSILSMQNNTLSEIHFTSFSPKDVDFSLTFYDFERGDIDTLGHAMEESVRSSYEHYLRHIKIKILGK